ncbi:MAG: ATP-dependent DNA helicase RecQ, partial [Candidatus Margulisbacteria bacterium]|nr:ATP-dependent DNA helicase RecQ [Candidatus Margulisiibacteriota bacterium]
MVSGTDNLISSLKRFFGYNTFRNHQKEIIEATLKEQDVFAVLPTGAGKSLCYQLPAIIRPGTTIVISPLIALMIDQVRQLSELNIPAAFLNSTLDFVDKQHLLTHLGNFKLIYVSPEKFMDPEFLARISDIPVSSVVIDEAHCISQWGHSFRPEYRKLSIIKERFPEVPVAAFTATATPQVANDIAELLALKDPLKIIGSFDRSNLMIRFHDRIHQKNQVSAFLASQKETSGIIYAPTRKKVDDTHSWLSDQGIHSVKYHAGLSESDRVTAQKAFI